MTLLKLTSWDSATMLELKPNCEFCDCDLPPEAENAYIPVLSQDACFRD